jgi:ATP-dependent Clp protease protease subunit
MAKNKSKFYSIRKIKAQNGITVGRVDIYGEISSMQFWGDEVTPAGFLSDLTAIGAVSEIECHIFSNGGDMFASLAIYSILKNRQERVKVYIDGVAASGGSIIACAGDFVYMPAEAMMFVHNLITAAFDVNEHDVREMLADMVKMKEPMINAYMQKSGKTREEIIALMDGESGNGTWLTAEEAIEFGLADGYTPVEMQPLEAAASISPAVFSYRGYRIDLTGFDKAAEKTAGIINSKRGGNSMAGFFKKKNKTAAKTNPKPKSEIVFVEMVCPSCNGAVNLNAATGEIFASNAEPQQEDPKGDGKEAPAAVLARRMPGNVRAAIYSVNCPHCGNDFVWDTDVNADGGEGTQTTAATPLGGAAPAPAAAPNQTQAGNAQAPSAETAQAVCPNCSAQVEYDTETAEVGVDEATGEEGYLLTCSGCNTQFIEPLAAPDPNSVPVGTSAEAQAAYRAGILAERNRQIALDEMAQAAPNLAGMIQAAKKSGASTDTMSRNVIKAMANGNGGSIRAAGFAAALGRDVAASGVNTMRQPKHAGPQKSIYQSAYDKYAAEYNQGRGGKDNGKA